MLFLCSRSRVIQRRFMSIYALGEGWTGALGGAHLNASIPGHDDEDVEDLVQEPLLIYKGKVQKVSTGWGHTLLIDDKGQLQVIGRPHDFQTLLRLRRLPQLLRQFSSENLFHRKEGFVSWLIGVVVGGFEGSSGAWDSAKKYSSVFDFTPMSLPDDVLPIDIRAGAGLSAVIGNNGTLYTFGLNSRGQCGTGLWSHNEWDPKMVLGLTTLGDSSLPPANPMQQVALGLQFGIALNNKGHVFSWGKGNRGQLGIKMDEYESNESARWISRIHDSLDQQDNPRERNFKATLIDTGLHHSAMLLEDNRVYIWGKFQSPLFPDSKPGKPSEDANFPIPVHGLPDLKIIDLQCGSHHTSLLMEDGSIWAFGLATDNTKPIHTPVQLCAAGIVQLPVRHFEAHFDRTTVVDANHAVFQMNLWDNPELQEYAVFSPTWLDLFSDKRIESVHRGWLHTLVVTSDDDDDDDDDDKKPPKQSN